MEKYLSTLSSYPYATVNALNFFFAAGANWVDQGAALLGLPYAVWGTVGLLASVVVGLVFFFKSRDRRAIPLCAALILAGLCAEGETLVDDSGGHIERGYCKIEKKLKAVGGHIARVDAQNAD